MQKRGPGRPLFFHPNDVPRTQLPAGAAAQVAPVMVYAAVTF